MSAWSRFWFEPGLPSTLGLCRLLFFTGVCLWQFQLDYTDWAAYSSVLWMPIWLFDRFNLPVLSSGALEVVQTLWKVSLVLSAVGWFTRAAMAVAFVLGVYLLGLPHNFGQTQHFDALAVFVLGAFAVSHAGRAWSIDALVAAARSGTTARPAPSGEYTWPIRFVWVAMALIFFAAGVSKLRHSGIEWAFSDNLALLLRRQQYHISDGEPLTSWGLTVAQYPVLSQTMAAASLAIETLFPLVLFSRTARLLLVPAALGFLIGIRTLMGPTFEQFMICFVFWVPWPQVAALVRHRVADWQPSRVVLYDGTCRMCARVLAVLERLDLLRRVRFVDVVASRGWVSARYPALNLDACLREMHVIDRHGSVTCGFDAYRSIAWVLPLGWPLLPALNVPGVPAVGRRVYRAVATRRSRQASVVSVVPVVSSAPVSRRAS
jgi:predicted DCC family thiol-disulfide oxidoreductase YuxK